MVSRFLQSVRTPLWHSLSLRFGEANEQALHNLLVCISPMRIRRLVLEYCGGPNNVRLSGQSCIRIAQRMKI